VSDEPPAGCEDFGYLCRPSIGPSSIAIYESDEVPELSGRLLSTTLKHGSIYSFDPAAGENGFTRYYLGANRLRDIEISDDARTIYISTDSHGGVVDPEGAFAGTPENPGAILVYTAK
jgi:glucose/arabinose dehydrogenase